MKSTPSFSLFPLEREIAERLYALLFFFVSILLFL